MLAERDWWLSVLPAGWRLHGWTYRERAIVFDALGGQQELNGIYIQTMQADGRLAP